MARALRDFAKSLSKVERDIRAKPRFVTGKFTEWIDSSHGKVDLGPKSIVATVPILIANAIRSQEELETVNEGDDGPITQLVVVRIQGSTYVISDVLDNVKAKLITEDDLTELKSLKPTNLVAASAPSGVVAEATPPNLRDTIGWSCKGLGKDEWIPGVNDGSSAISAITGGVSDKEYLPGTGDGGVVTTWFRPSSDSAYDYLVWPVVDPVQYYGSSLTISCTVMEKGVGNEQLVTFGVDWYSPSGTYVTQSLDPDYVSTRTKTREWRQYDASYLESIVRYPTVTLTQTFVIPSDIQFFRPFLQVNASGPQDLFITDWKIYGA